ncbi:hypothetical protein ANCDUO_12772 [Ancylostoma duodenale]|uniref:Uncharacterized protein n=1 Tax=Ancylostoma duodenale TaxID=51022 RepID=A0A0C2GDS2_9BILA|nr:hypothetical protein ANCDUO_12772 [Ancylostoma duodenale]
MSNKVTRRSVLVSTAKMSILQKIQDIEDEMARTQKNKATNAHLGMLKAKLAKLRQELIAPKGGGGGGGEGFDVAKTGDARIGFDPLVPQTYLYKMSRLSYDFDKSMQLGASDIEAHREKLQVRITYNGETEHCSIILRYKLVQNVNIYYI